jgi:hypothetical protein
MGFGKQCSQCKIPHRVYKKHPAKREPPQQQKAGSRKRQAGGGLSNKKHLACHARPVAVKFQEFVHVMPFHHRSSNVTTRNEWTVRRNYYTGVWVRLKWLTADQRTSLWQT